MTDSGIPMTDAEIDQQITLFRRRLRPCAALGARCSRRPRHPGNITPSQATAICGRSESQVRRDCEANPIDAGGFGLKIAGRWYGETRMATLCDDLWSLHVEVSQVLQQRKNCEAPEAVGSPSVRASAVPACPPEISQSRRVCVRSWIKCALSEEERLFKIERRISQCRCRAC
jgi:hypothetical protein